MIAIYKARISIGLFLLVLHSSAIIMIFYFGSKIMTFEDTTTSILIIAPLTANYVSIFLKDLVNHQFEVEKLQNVCIKLSAFFIQILVIAIFGGFLIAIVYVFSFSGSMSVEQFRIYLGIIETAFGVFVGIVMAGTFNVK